MCSASIMSIRQRPTSQPNSHLRLSALHPNAVHRLLHALSALLFISSILHTNQSASPLLLLGPLPIFMPLHAQLPKVPCLTPKSLDASRHEQFKASFISLSAPAQRPSLPASFRSQLPMSMHSSSARDRTHALAVCHTYMTASFYTFQTFQECFITGGM